MKTEKTKMHFADTYLISPTNPLTVNLIGAGGTGSKVLTALMEETIGETIPSKSRETRFVWARAMVVYQLRQEGFTLMEIGRMMGMHHSSVFHLEGKMKDALMYSFAYRDVIDIWKQFQNRINNDIQRGTTQDLICV